MRQTCAKPINSFVSVAWMIHEMSLCSPTSGNPLRSPEQPGTDYSSCRRLRPGRIGNESGTTLRVRASAIREALSGHRSHQHLLYG